MGEGERGGAGHKRAGAKSKRAGAGQENKHTNKTLSGQRCGKMLQLPRAAIKAGD